MIELQDFEKHIGARTLYQGVNITLSKQVTAVVWPNWSGKTTLFRCLSWKDSDYSGAIRFDRSNPLIGHMEQEMADFEDSSILDFIRNKIGVAQLELDIAEIYEKMSDVTADQNKLMIELSEKQEQFDLLGGYIVNESIIQSIVSLWFDKEDVSRKISTLSGWQKRKILLATMFLKGVDLVLLDEPTNDLDMLSVHKLVDFIKSRASSVLIISHDVSFIKAVSGSIIEINPLTHSIEKYNVGYDEFVTSKELRFQRALEAYERQQEEVKRLNQLLQEERNSVHKKAPQRKDNNKGAYNKAKEDSQNEAGKRIEKIKAQIQKATLEKPVKKSPLRFDLGISEMARGSIVIRDGEFKYPDSEFTLRIPRFELSAGKRVVLLGANGTGKSTLMRIIIGELNMGQEVEKGSSFRFGVFNQAHEDLMKYSNAKEYLTKKSIRSDLNDQDILQALARFEIRGELVYKDVHLLSPWERVRIILALFNVNKYNTLILDEPTNHLDIEAVEELWKAIDSFEWTLCLSSHDSHFIELINWCEFYKVEDWTVSEIDSLQSYVKSLLK